jgi:hypothetical protein
METVIAPGGGGGAGVGAGVGVGVGVGDCDALAVPVTTTVPVIPGWSSQRYGYVPGRWKTWVKVEPLAIVASNERSFAVTVWGTRPWLAQVTVVPTGTVIVTGWNSLSTTVILVAPLGTGGGAGVDGGGGGGGGGAPAAPTTTVPVISPWKSQR